MHFNVTAAASTMYGATSEDHNADTLTNTYTAGAAFSGKYNQGTKIYATGADLSSTTANKVFMVECDRCCSIWIVSSTSANYGICFTFGEIVERAADGVGLWGHLTSRATMTGLEGGYETSNVAAAVGYVESTAVQVAGGIYDTVTKGLGRASFTPANSAMVDTFQNQANDTAFIVPIIMSTKQVAGSILPYGIGVLRQMRYSIKHTGQLQLRDSANNVKGYLVNAGFSNSGRGLFFDQAP
jgi:hypothetical protein